MCNCEKPINIKFSKEHDGCIIPSRTYGNAGFDLYADPEFIGVYKYMHGLETLAIPTGIRSVIPPTHYFQIQERGSTGIKAMKYGAGVIDSNYRGIWNIIITNCSEKGLVLYDPNKISEEDLIDKLFEESDMFQLMGKDFITEACRFYPITKGIAQAVLLPVPKIEVEEITPEEVLEHKTDRMEGKFGSSGK